MNPAGANEPQDRDRSGPELPDTAGLPEADVNERLAGGSQPASGDASVSAVASDGVDAETLRREVWRLRDEVFGLEGQKAELQSDLVRVDAARRTAENRATAFEEGQRQRDAMVGSAQWRIGGLLLAPFRRLRGLLRRVVAGL
jgi:hypothetical protein